MNSVEELIIDLAEYIKGNRGDSFGYFNSFFKRSNYNGCSPLDSLITHEFMMGVKLRSDRILTIDPYKKRTMNFWK